MAKIKTRLLTETDIEKMPKTDNEGNLSNEFVELILSIFNSRIRGYISKEKFRLQLSVLFMMTNSDVKDTGETVLPK